MSANPTYSVLPRDEQTGEERLIEQGTYEADKYGLSTLLFSWCENNFACDCNRGDVFYPDAESDFPCSGAVNRFTLLALNVADVGDLLAATPEELDALPNWHPAHS